MLISALFSLLPLLASLPISQAATADEWRNRSVYQLFTDRFAPVNEGDPCNIEDGKYCGGNWRTVIGKLDYIQGMGYDAIWISPTGMNVEGQTPYGEAYHGYWVTDPTRVNPHFGTDDDLKALSNALHERGMYLMVDVAINALASTQNDMSDSALAQAEGGNLLFKHADNYHKSCNIAWGNRNSEETCWLANDKVWLMDLDQENEEVKSTLLDWAPKYVAEYGIDGFRIDASKHMTRAWQHDFCTAAGVFCVGEVYSDDPKFAGGYQGEGGIDAVFGFDMKSTLISVFGDKSPKPISAISGAISRAKSYPDQSLVGAFLDNHDLPRFGSLVTDKAKGYNAIVANFLYGGLPIVYYGLEQDINEARQDPYNRPALWLYNNFATSGDTYQRIKTLNKVRSELGKAAGFYDSPAEVLENGDADIALKRGEAVIVLTSRGSGASGSYKVSKAGFTAGATVVDLLSCDTVTADSDGAITATSTDGRPFVFVDEKVAAAGGFCDLTAGETSASASPSSTALAGSPSVSASGPAASSAGGNLIVSTTSAAATGGATGSPSTPTNGTGSGSGSGSGSSSGGKTCKRSAKRRLHDF